MGGALGIVAEVCYLILLAAAFAMHLYMMIEPLHLWGQGNLYYISTTLFLVSQTTISILLLIENYLYVFLPHWIRLGVFIGSIFSVIYWAAMVAVGGDLYVYAEKPSDTLENIVVVYMTLINLP